MPPACAAIPLFKMALDLAPSDRELLFAIDDLAIGRTCLIPRALLRMGRAMIDHLLHLVPAGAEAHRAGHRRYVRRGSMAASSFVCSMRITMNIGFQPHRRLRRLAGRFVTALLRPAPRRPQRQSEVVPVMRRLLRAIRTPLAPHRNPAPRR